MILRSDINPNSNVPLYLQIVNKVIGLIEEGKLKKNDKLISVNNLYKAIGISRVTVVNAYDELRRKGIIEAMQGKGYFVSRENDLNTKKVFVLFDAMNSYKEVLYRSFIEELGNGYSTDIFFHYYSTNLFKQFILNNNGDYHCYVVLAHLHEDVSEILTLLPQNKLWLVDADVPNLTSCGGIFQNFSKDVYQALTDAKNLLIKYNRLIMVKGSLFQFIPDGIANGLKQFCTDNQIDYQIVETLNNNNLSKKNAYLVFTDNDLITLIQYSRQHGLKPGSDIGLVSYDETPLKSLLEEGITVISTDFKYMGQMAAKMIKENIHSKIENPCRLIIRKSL